MDGGDDCPAARGKLAQGSQQMHGGGAIQPRGGLICKCNFFAKSSDSMSS